MANDHASDQQQRILTLQAKVAELEQKLARASLQPGPPVVSATPASTSPPKHSVDVDQSHDTSSRTVPADEDAPADHPAKPAESGNITGTQDHRQQATSNEIPSVSKPNVTKDPDSTTGAAHTDSVPNSRFKSPILSLTLAELKQASQKLQEKLAQFEAAEKKRQSALTEAKTKYEEYVAASDRSRAISTAGLTTTFRSREHKAEVIMAALRADAEDQAKFEEFGEAENRYSEAKAEAHEKHRQVDKAGEWCKIVKEKYEGLLKEAREQAEQEDRKPQGNSSRSFHKHQKVEEMD